MCIYIEYFEKISIINFIVSALHKYGIVFCTVIVISKENLRILFFTLKCYKNTFYNSVRAELHVLKCDQKFTCLIIYIHIKIWSINFQNMI